MSLVKDQHFRSPTLMASAKGRCCTANIPGYCNYKPETSQWAHSNKALHGKGRGIKAHDVFGAIVCSDCHDVIDGRKGSEFSDSERFEFWQRAHVATMLLLLDEGVLLVIKR